MSERDDFEAIHRLDQALDELAAGPPRVPDGSDQDAAIARLPGPHVDTEVLNLNGTADRDTEVLGARAGVDADADTEVIRTDGAGAHGSGPDGSKADGSKADGWEVDALAALAAELLASAPPPPQGAAERGRATLLAAAGTRRRGGRVRWAALLAAILLLAAVPAVAAPTAEPGSPLWAVREAGQEVRVSLSGDELVKANLRFDNAAGRIERARERVIEHRDDPPDKLRERVDRLADEAVEDAGEGLTLLERLSGPAADQARARGRRLYAEADALRNGIFGDLLGPGDPGGNQGPGGDDGDDRGEDLDDNRGPDGDDDADDSNSGRGGGDDGGGQGRGRGRGRSGEGGGD